MEHIIQVIDKNHEASRTEDRASGHSRAHWHPFRGNPIKHHTLHSTAINQLCIQVTIFVDILCISNFCKSLG